MAATFRQILGGNVYWSVQNMNKGWDTRGGAKGPLWRHGRAHLWLRLTAAQRAERAAAWCLGLSWCFGGRACRAGLVLGDWNDDTDLGFSFAVPGISLHFDIENTIPTRYRPRDGRDFGFFVNGGNVYLKLWCSLHEWHNDRPFSDPGSSKRQPVLHVLNWLLGKTRHTQLDLAVEQLTIELPEGVYQVQVKLSEHTWKRPLWRARVIGRAEVELLPEGTVLPAADDDHALYSLTTNATTVDEALGALRRKLDQYRKQGNIDWIQVRS